MAAALHGREPELARLLEPIRRLRSVGDPVVVIVSGEPGIGKTRLLEEVIERAPQMTLFRLAGYEHDFDIPLSAAHSLVREVTDVGAASAVPSDDLNVARLFEGAYQTIVSAAPVLVVMDDLQWSDDTSLALLRYVIRGGVASRTPIGVMAASRQTARAWRHIDSLLEPIPADNAVHVDLGPLQQVDSARLIRSLDPEADDDTVARWHEMAGGSPFWLEVLAGSRLSGADPGSLLAHHTQRLDADATAALIALALAGRPLVEDDLDRILRWPEGRAPPSLSDLEGSGLAIRGNGMVRVAHDLVRQEAIGGASPELVRKLRGLIGEWLESRAGSDPILLLEALEHQTRAGKPIERLALRILHSPARGTIGADGLFRVATVTDSIVSSELDTAVAELAVDLGEYELALDRWSRFNELSGDHAARRALASSEAALHLGRHAEAWSLLEMSRRNVESDPLLPAEIEAQEAQLILVFEGEPERSLQLASRAVDSLSRIASSGKAADSSMKKARLRTLLAAMDAARGADRIEQTLTFAEEAAEVAAGRDALARMRALTAGGLALRMLGRNLDAEARIRVAWTESRRHLLLQASLESGAMLAKVLHSLGRLIEAETVVEACLDLGGRLVEYRPGRAFLNLFPHILTVSRNDWRAGVDGLLSIAETEDEPHYRLHPRAEAMSTLATFDPSGAADLVRQLASAVVEDAERAGCLRCQNEAGLRAGDALARVGDVTEAGGHLTRVKSRLPDADRLLGWWAGVAGASIAVSAAKSDAEASLIAAISDADSQDLLFEAMRGRLDLGRYLVTRRPAEAGRVIRDAGWRAEGMGANTEARVADQLLRRLGFRTWRRKESPPGDEAIGRLTDREREVAWLVAGGASNPDVAATLFLSRKTVERHLSNIFAKLGVRNRVELVNLLQSNAEGVPR